MLPSQLSKPSLAETPPSGIWPFAPAATPSPGASPSEPPLASEDATSYSFMLQMWNKNLVTLGKFTLNQHLCTFSPLKYFKVRLDLATVADTDKMLPEDPGVSLLGWPGQLQLLQIFVGVKYKRQPLTPPCCYSTLLEQAVEPWPRQHQVAPLPSSLQAFGFQVCSALGLLPCDHTEDTLPPVRHSWAQQLR